ncbi:uncharacterized protein ISCGN_023460 [Ixodes scapularis]
MYTAYIGDGDSKAFLAVKESKPYNKDVEKHECVGHVQKRMGTRLRSMKASLKGKRLSDGLTLSGKGRLTEKDIDSLQFYYGKAIRDNTDSLQNMRKAVWAIYFHKLSTDEKPNHGLCPNGPSSWCGYNRSLSDGNPETYLHRNSLPTAVLEAIKPVFQALSSPGLLSKRLHGRTQNTNESLNQLIWCRCPKTTFVGTDTVKIAKRVVGGTDKFHNGDLLVPPQDPEVLRGDSTSPNRLMAACKSERMVTWSTFRGKTMGWSISFFSATIGWMVRIEAVTTMSKSLSITLTTAAA